MLKLKLIYFSFLFISVHLWSSPIGTYPIRSFQADHSLKTIAEDQYGNIIAGGDDGLFILKEGIWERLGNQQFNISILEAGSNGRILIGDHDYFGVFETDSISKLSDELASELEFKNIQKVISASTGDFIHLDNKILKLESAIIEYQFENVIYAGLLNRDLLIQRKDQGLYIYAGNDFRKINGSEVYARKEIKQIIELPESRFLLLFANDAIIYDGDNFLNWSSMGANWIRKINPDYAMSNTEGIFLSSKKTLYQLDHEGNLLRQTDLGFEVSDMLGQKNGTVWLVGDQKAISLRSKSPIGLIHSLNETGRAFAEVNSKFVIGTERGAYELEQTSFLNDGLSFPIYADRINAIYINEEERFLSGESGLRIVNGRINSTAIQEQSNGVILLEQEGILIEASSSGLNLYERENRSYSFQNHLYGIEEEVFQILRDEKDRLWARSKDKGISLLNYDEVLRTINPNFFSVDEKPGINLNGIFIVNGKPVVTTTQGIYEFNETVQKFQISKVYNEIFGSENNINYLFQDQRENIWYLSERESGVLKVVDRGVEKETDKIIIPELQRYVNFNHPGIYSFDDHQIIMNSINGFLHVNELKVKDIDPFQVLVYQLKSFNQSLDLIENKWIRSPDLKNLFLLDKKTKSIELKLSSSISIDDSLVTYSYNVNDTGWSELLETNIISAELLPGSNNIKMRAHYGFNLVSNTLVIPFVVHQPWYLKEGNLLPVILASAFLAILAIYLTWRTMIIRKKKLKALERKIEEQNKTLDELRSKNEILSNQLLSAHHDTDIKIQLEKLYNETNDSDLKKAIKKLNKKMKTKGKGIANSIKPDPEFITKLKVKYPHLTQKDIRLCSLLKLDLTTKDIAPILDITVRGVEISRYRLRKKLDLDNDVVLADFLKTI